jgi:hypothetical protein
MGNYTKNQLIPIGDNMTSTKEQIRQTKSNISFYQGQISKLIKDKMAWIPEFPRWQVLLNQETNKLLNLMGEK